MELVQNRIENRNRFLSIRNSEVAIPSYTFFSFTEDKKLIKLLFGFKIV